MISDAGDNRQRSKWQEGVEAVSEMGLDQRSS
jgi:hypothetical protein